MNEKLSNLKGIIKKKTNNCWGEILNKKVVSKKLPNLIVD